MKLYRIKKSKIDKKGRGLYATRDIREGTKIIDYVGMDQPLKSCGSYMFEKNGYKLFSEVEGSLEAINGMPINYLLENLERHV